MPVMPLATALAAGISGGCGGIKRAGRPAGDVLKPVGAKQTRERASRGAVRSVNYRVTVVGVR